MKLIPRALVFSLSLTILTNCGSPPASSNQAGSNRNTNAAASNSSPTNANIQTNQSSTGAIEVTSAPPGARVLLISDDESGAGEPETKGLTPTTITGVQPGKYTVHLERSGYKFFQKEITVKAGATVKVNGVLKKQ
jgi:PEGA domain-containing protein